LSLECTQCGAKIDPHKDQTFYNCPYCSSTLFIEKGKSIQHYCASLKIARKDLESILRTWLSSGDLPQEASLISAALTYFPFWYFEFGGSKNYLTPANTSEVEEVNRIELPAVELRPFSVEGLGGASLVEPQFLHEITLEKIVKTTNYTPGELVSSSLIHLPLWTITYAYGTDPAVYTAVVEAIGGAVYASVMPAPPLKGLRVAYYSLAYGSLAAFAIAGFVAPNLWWRLGLYAVITPAVFVVGRKIIEKYG
jgi:DNA-directed RNA polymerase subunit RPC12/RpoP